MTIGLAVTLVLVGLVGALLSGMLGIGGAIVNYPMLLYVPVWFGVGNYTPHEVAGIVALQVLFATLSGVIALLKKKVIHYKLVAYMGVSILIGSFVGAYGSKFLPGSSINIIYAVLATIAAVMMFVPRRGVDDAATDEIQFSRIIAMVAAVIVGMAAGVVGAGGAFILVPIMLQVMKIPLRVTIASSLAITFVSSLGATAGKVMAGNIPFLAALIVVIASVFVAPVGIWLGRRLNARALRAILAVLIVATSVKIWVGFIA